MKYLNGVDGVTGAQRTMARLATVLGAVAPAAAAPSTALAVQAKPSVVSTFIRDLRSEVPPDVKDGIGTVLGAGAGAYLWRKKHVYLGGIGGASLGRNLPALMKPEQRMQAIRNLSVTSAGMLGSFALPKNPAIGFVLGWLAGGAATYFGGLR
jgi:hypothetical protein